MGRNRHIVLSFFIMHLNVGRDIETQLYTELRLFRVIAIPRIQVTGEEFFLQVQLFVGHHDIVDQISQMWLNICALHLCYIAYHSLLYNSNAGRASKV